MPNGRCHLHGGRSTEAARAAAHTKHGHYSAEVRTFLAAGDPLLHGVPKPPARGRGAP